MSQEMQEPATDQTAKRQPVDKLQDGRLSVAIWANDGEHGPIYNATLAYSYKDKDGNWRSTESIPGNELLKAAHLSERAYASIQLLRDQDRAKYVQEQQEQAEQGQSQSRSPTR